MPLQWPRRWQPIAVVLGVALAAAGCGPKMHAVRGKVTYTDGQPVPEGMVVFESTDTDKPVTARGAIQPDGSYELSTNRPGDGALPGKYRVLVAPKSDPNAVDRPQAGPPFDKRYMSFATSGLTFEVPAPANDYPIQVTRAKK